MKQITRTNLRFSAGSIIVCMLLVLAIGCKRQSLGKMAPTSASQMVAMAFDPDDPDRRREGVRLLTKRDWGRQEPYLKGYATLLNTDTDPSVRSAAVRALGRAGYKKYMPDVINALDDEAVSVRWDAAVALDDLVGEAAIEPLAEHALDDESADVRAACAVALRHYHKLRAIRALRQCLADEDFGVRYQARRSLVVLMGRDLGPEPQDWSEARLDGKASQPAGKAKRPWWDWFNISKRNKDHSAKAAETDQSAAARPRTD